MPKQVIPPTPQETVYSPSGRETAIKKTKRVIIYQSIVAILAFLTAPEVVEMLIKYFPAFTALIAAGAPILTLIYNIMRKDVKNWQIAMSSPIVFHQMEVVKSEELELQEGETFRFITDIEQLFKLIGKMTICMDEKYPNQFNVVWVRFPIEVEG